MSLRTIESLEPRQLLATFLPDVTFGRGGYVSSIRGDLSFVQHDDRVVVLDNQLFAEDVVVTRLNVDGQIDTRFPDDLKHLPRQSTVCTATPLADDRYLLGLFRGDVANVATVMQFSSAGELDESFGVGGSANITFPAPDAMSPIAHVTIRNIASTAQGIYVLATLDARPAAGGAIKVASLARLTRAGVLDKTFGTGGFRTMGTTSSGILSESRLAATASNLVYVLAYQSQTALLWRLDSAGKPDKSWNTTGQATVAFASTSAQPSLAVQSNGQPIVGGAWNDQTALWRFNLSGSLDTTFAQSGRADLTVNVATGDVDTAGTIQTLQVLPDNRIVAIDGSVVFRCDASGKPDLTFDTDGQAAMPYSTVHAVDSTGRVIINGNQRFAERGLATLATDGTLYITGDDSDDSISIRDVGTRVRVSGQTGAYNFNFGKARRLSVDLRGGGDLLTSSTILPITINAAAGDDTIYCASTQDTIIGGDGDDSITTGIGNDVVYLDQGDDTVNTGDGHDLVVDGYADTAGSDDDSVITGAGNDTVKLAYGNNTVLAGDGDDYIKTGNGNNNIDGGLGRDFVRTGSGNDTIDGGGGRDNLIAGAGNDLVIGGSNDDILVGGPGQDTFIGNAGNDLIVSADPEDSLPDSIDGGSGTDTLYSDTDDLFTAVEQIIQGPYVAPTSSHHS